MISAMKLAILASAGFAAMASATTIHVNHGCIVVDETPICQTDGRTTVNVDAGFANIYGRFDSNELQHKQVPPGCTLQASWPTNYGDIFYGNDACLYDATGNNIGGQCCVPGTSAPGTVQNPYIIA